MPIMDLPIFQALKSKMHWHQARQGVLAENIANANTPGYRARDLQDYSFSDHVGRETFAMATSVTEPGHIAGSISGTMDGQKVIRAKSAEMTPSGNNIVLEEQMMNVTQNQLDYQAAASLYTKSLGLVRKALSKNA